MSDTPTSDNQGEAPMNDKPPHALDEAAENLRRAINTSSVEWGRLHLEVAREWLRVAGR